MPTPRVRDAAPPGALTPGVFHPGAAAPGLHPPDPFGRERVAGEASDVRALPTDGPGTDAGTRCSNCGSGHCEHFCPRCGQETQDLHRSLRGIVGELLDAFAGWDGKIPVTVWLLVSRPGTLTREFLTGRRARYLRPLRLYLSASVAFFLSLTLVPSPSARDGLVVRPDSGFHFEITQTPGGAAAAGARTPTAPGRTAAAGAAAGARRVNEDSAFAAFLERHRNEPGHGPLVWMKRHFSAGILHVRALPKAEQRATLREAFVARAPNAVFLLLPVFALLLRLLYWQAPVFYAEHFVFALHVHAFAFVAMLLAHVGSVWLAPVGWAAVSAAPLFWLPAYLLVAMRRAYGGTWRRTLPRFVAVSAVYGAILFAATLATVVVTIALLA